MILEYIRTQVQNEERESFTYPKGDKYVEKKHPKLTIYDGSQNAFLRAFTYGPVDDLQ